MVALGLLAGLGGRGLLKVLALSLIILGLLPSLGGRGLLGVLALSSIALGLLPGLGSYFCDYVPCRSLHDVDP